MTDYTHWLVIISACISIAGSSAYIRDTIAGRTKPNRISWFMWALAPLIGTAAALSARADPWSTVRVFLSGFLPLLIFLASFLNRQSYWKLSIFDISCSAFSVLALAVWALVDSPRLAVLLAATADGFAALPTIRKAWLFPETETAWTYPAGLLSVLLVLPSIPDWTIENSAFQIYLLLANCVLTFSVYKRHFIKRYA